MYIFATDFLTLIDNNFRQTEQFRIVVDLQSDDEFLIIDCI